jgi:tagatose 1,6-diphosphate aldolase
VNARSALSARRPIHGIAVDMGSGLGEALRAARGASARDDDLFTFKRIVAEALSRTATTLLVDAEYGRDLLASIHPPCLPMLAYEADVYRISDDDRMTVLPDNLAISDYPGLGVGALKFFLYYGPDDAGEINARKHALVRRIGADCRAVGIEFLFEPIVYHRDLPDTGSAAFARLKPSLVERATRTFAAPEFGIDILKVELPVSFGHVEGLGEPTMTMAEAEAAFRNAAAAAGDIPILYLSAGVTFEQFEAGLKLARCAGVDPAGFMCGRAVWSDAIGVFGAHGPVAAGQWMAKEGVRRLERLAEALA